MIYGFPLMARQMVNPGDDIYDLLSLLLERDNSSQEYPQYRYFTKIHIHYNYNCIVR